MAGNMPIATAASRNAPSVISGRCASAKCALDRKVLADLAATDAAAFNELVTIAKNALKAKPAATLAKA